MSALTDSARSYVEANISVIPIADLRVKRPAEKWGAYQKAYPQPIDITRWFGPQPGLAIVCGRVSGGITVFDFDARDGTGLLYADWAKEVELALPRLVAQLPTVTTQNGGTHVYVRCEEVNGNTKLASDAAGTRTCIETRGEGGYAVAPPTPGYTLISGDLLDIPVIAPADMVTLFTIARSFDASPLDTEYGPERHAIGHDQDKDDRPGVFYNHTVTMGQFVTLLTDAGWQYAHTRRDRTVVLTRPGKDLREGTSATIRDGAVPIFYNFSANAAPFHAGKGYSPFQVYGMLRHNGHFDAAARDLYAQQNPPLRLVRDDERGWEYAKEEPATPQAGEPDAEDEYPYFPVYSMADLLRMPRPQQLIASWMLKSPLTVIYAESGAGKTFLAISMACSVASGRPWYGHEVIRGPVLYIAAEGGSGMGIRAQAWCEMFNDGVMLEPPHLSFITQPAYPTVKQTTEAILGSIRRAEMTRASVIVIDTLARCFGDGDENSTKDMGAFIMALDALHRATGACIWLVHHMGWGNNGHMRGSSALRAGADTSIGIAWDADEETMTVKADKIKDLENPKPMVFRRKKVLESLVLENLAGYEAAADDLKPSERAVLEALALPSMAGSTIRDLVAAKCASQAQIYRVIVALGKARYITSTGEEKSVNRKHFITTAGLAAVKGGF